MLGLGHAILTGEPLIGNEPFAVVLAVLMGLEQASKILGDMAATYFVAVAGIVAAFFGAQAFTKK